MQEERIITENKIKSVNKNIYICGSGENNTQVPHSDVKRMKK